MTDAQESDELIGRVLNGQYQVVSRLGAGGFGSVYKVVQLGMSRTSAVKLCREDATSTVMMRLQREGQILCRLKNKNIVSVHAIGHDATLNALFLVMDFIEGITLSEYIAKNAPLQPAEVTRLATEICCGLVSAHQANVVHRDLKPGNIMLVPTPEGPLRPVILDFGISKDFKIGEHQQKLTTTGSFLGSPLYVSPEQICGSESVDCRSDIYSLGCILFEMISGQPPFTGDTPFEIAHKHLAQEAADLKTISNSDPSANALLSIIHRTLQKDPSKRFQTSEELMIALEQASINPFQSLQLQPGHKSFSELRVVAASLCITIMVIGIIAGGVALLQSGNSEQPRRNSVSRNQAPNLNASGTHSEFGLHNEFTEDNEFTKNNESAELEDSPKVTASAQARENAQHYSEAQAFFKKRMYGEATNSARLCIKNKFRESDCQKIIASCHEQLKDTEVALARVTGYLRKAPHSEYLLSRRGALNVDLGNWKAAEVDYTSALRINPNRIFDLAGRAYAYSKQKKILLATQDWDKACGIQPYNSQAYRARGLFRVDEQGNFSEAIEDYRRAIELGANDYEIHVALGRALYRAKAYEKSLAEFRIALKINPKDPGANRGVVDSLILLDRPKEALAEIEQWEKKDLPDKGNLYLKRAQAYAILTDRKPAMAALKEAWNLSQDDDHLKMECRNLEQKINK